MPRGGGPGGHGGGIHPAILAGARPGDLYGARFIQPAATGNVIGENDNIFDDSIRSVSRTMATMRSARLVKKGIPGILLGIRMVAMGPHHNTVFNSKVRSADALLADKRITKEQCCLRKMQAAKKFYDYHVKIGYYTREYADALLQNYASSIGVNYVIDGERTRGR